MFFLKHATESSFLISIGVLFHSLVAETAKERRMARQMAREVTYNNFEISLVVFLPNITTNHVITYANVISKNI